MYGIYGILNCGNIFPELAIDRPTSRHPNFGHPENGHDPHVVEGASLKGACPSRRSPARPAVAAVAVARGPVETECGMSHQHHVWKNEEKNNG